MPRLKLKSASLRNFGSVRCSTVDFPDRGFVLVNGLNEVGAGKFESVGSGKTLLGEAISRALFNVPGRFTRFAQYSTDGKGDTYVAVRAELDGRPLLVEHGYKCRELNAGGEGLRVTLEGDAPIQRATLDQTREELGRLVGVIPEVATWTIYIDGSQLSFGRLNEAQTVNLLMGALNQPPWHEYRQKADKARQKFAQELEVANSARQLATAQVLQAGQDEAAAAEQVKQTRAELDRNLKAFELRREARQQAQQKLESASRQLEAESADLAKQIELAVAAEAQEFAQAELVHSEAVSALAAANRQQAVLLQQGVDLSGALRAAEAAQAEARAAARREAHQLVEARLRDIRQAKDVAQKTLTSVQATLSKVERARRSVELELSKLEAVPTTCPMAGCAKQWPSPHQAKIAELRFELEAKQADQLKMEVLVSGAQQALDAAQLVPEPPLPDLVESELPVPLELTERILSVQGAQLIQQQRLTEARAEVQKQADWQVAAKAQVDRLRQASSVAPLSRRLEELERQLKDATRQLQQSKLEQANDTVDDSAWHRAESKLEERQLQKQAAESRLAEASVAKSDAEQAVAVAEYWAEAFSPTGIPNLIIDESIAPLNDVSKRVAFAMTGGIINVSYATSRTLASGKSRSEIQLAVHNLHGAGSANGSSKGEAGLTDWIVAETLAEVGNVASRVGYRWYDEIARSQDGCIRRSLFSYLRDLSRRLGILFFVVDHSPEVANYADHVLRARKTASGTVYDWA